MFELDLFVRMKIMVPEALNTQLENGNSEAYLALENHLSDQLNSGTEYKVTKFQIDDARAGEEWETSQFHE